MAEKDVPIKEQEDGSVLAKVEENAQEQFEEDLKNSGGLENKPDADKDSDDEGEEPEDLAEGGEAGDDDDEAERERIREARREERRLKKELQKQRDASAKHKISSLERRNEELARRLANLENSAVSFKMAQIDKAVEDEATRVEYAKMKMLEAAQNNNAAGQIEYLDQLTEAKQKLQQLQHYKKQQLEAAKKPQKQNVPNPVSREVEDNAKSWLNKNSWFDPEARDTDSRIAKVIDQELSQDGWDPADPEYWDELDNRLSQRLPHRYTAKGGNASQRRPAGPAASSRTASPTAKPNTITLSRERVQAIKDAGAWDNVEKRNKMIRAYAAYDRANKE